MRRIIAINEFKCDGCSLFVRPVIKDLSIWLTEKLNNYVKIVVMVQAIA